LRIGANVAAELIVFEGDSAKELELFLVQLSVLVFIQSLECILHQQKKGRRGKRSKKWREY